MLRSHLLRWTALPLCGALAVIGCVGTTDTGQQGETGSLSVDLVLGDGLEIDKVGWEITGNGMDMSGDIDVSAPGSTASVEVFGLPPGETDYTVTLTATTTDQDVTCRGSAPFNVEVGQTTNVMVMLNCKKPRTLGGVRVNGKFNICTELTKAVVSPLQTSVGNDISLSAQAFDEEGDAISYIWTGDGGSIADPSAASTTYTCEDVGDHTVMIMVTDNDDYCRMATWTIPVTCVEGDGGDLCEDVMCEDDGNECTEAECNPANGACETSNVDNDTPCNDDLGMCVDGACVTDLCADVTCDDTGNDCTVAMCNTETGQCETMDVADGTECNGGTGACSAGVCVDSALCDNVVCTSENDCVQDGTCDPATGNCIAGDNEPADTACNADSGDVCDGAGNCVECNIADQCPDDGNACTAAACESNACAQNNVMDGQACDFDGSAGVCETGTCVAAAECVSPGDCDDGNPCTVGDCPDGMCVYTPADGGSCEVSAGVPGTCSGGSCVECIDATQCPGGGECMVATCESSTCGLANAANGTPCADATGTCMDGACEVSQPVIGTGSGVSDWRALPKVCDVGVFDATAFSFTCTTPRTPAVDVPNGGTANAFCSGTPSGCPYAGCSVPSATLAGQLAVDVFIELSAASSGDGNLTHNYTVTAVNAALGIAAAIANLVDITVFTDVTSANPAQVVNILDPAFANTTLGFYVVGGTTLVLDNEIPSATTAVVPTSSPDVAVNFSGEFLLELFLTTAMAPLDVDSSNCAFDLPGPDIILPVE